LIKLSLKNYFMRIFIAAPDIFAGDAVGNHCIGMLRALQRLGIDARAFASSHDLNAEPIEQLFELITENDILFVSYSIFDPLLERLLALPGGKIGYFHGVTSAELLREFDPITADICARSVEQYPLLNQFDILLANSSWTAQSLAPYLDYTRIKILPPVLPDMPIFQRQYTPRRQTEYLNILVVGRVVPHKRLEDALEILAIILQAGIPAKLNIVGSAPNHAYNQFLIQQTTDLGIQDAVNFAGMVSNEDLFAYYEAADTLLSVSLHEGFCVPVLEAMTYGIPVVVRTGTAADELADNAAASFHHFQQAADALIKIHTDHTIRESMAIEGNQRAAIILSKVSDPEIHSILQPIH
jgi:glycosyltransferase involved in cell wall biosynthesis